MSRPGHFRVETASGVFTAPALVLATGGLSIPKMGATGFSHDVARQFGLAITETRPGLVPLTVGAGPSGLDPALAGLSQEAVVSFEKRRFRENILFTHRGLSGPAILQISTYWRPGAEITIDLLPDLDAAAFLVERKRTRPKAAMQTVLADVMPARLAQALTTAHLLPDDLAPGERAPAELANMPERTLIGFASRLKAWTVRPTGTEGYAKAEVTRGGIDTRELSSKTMAARNVGGLFAIGEAVDVTGWLGGYNFQWAWSSGRAAGESL